MTPQPDHRDPKDPRAPEGVSPGDEGSRAEALEDRILVQRFLEAKEAGDREGLEAAFRMLLLRYQERIHRLVLRYVRDPLEAEDVTQDVFLKVYRKLDGFQGDSAFFTWLYRVAANTAVDHVAKRKRRPLHLSDDPSALVGSPKDGEPRSGLSSETPDEPMLRRERVRITREICDALPEPYKTTLFLREFEELSYLEIAEVSGCSIGTVESRLFRARARFRKLLEERHPELLQE